MRAFGRLDLRAVECAGFVSLLTLAAGTSQAANNVGWVLADQPTVASYTPNPKYSFNSAHGVISIQKLAQGEYRVIFDKLYDGGTGESSLVLVSAYNTSGRCISGQASASGSSVTASVGCFTSSGGLTDAPFALLYQSRGTDFGNAHRGVAYTTVSRGTNVESFDSSGQQVSALQDHKGNYFVYFRGLSDTGTVQITPNGTAIDPSGAEARCKVADRIGTSSYIRVNVHCYTTGEFANENFDIGYAVGESLGVVGGVQARAASALANNPTSTKAYAPPIQYNGFGTGRLTAQKTGTGQYTVTIPGTVSYGTSNALVTAYGSGSNYCNIAGWTTNAISVACYDQSGAPADSQFDVSFQTAN